MEHSCFLQIIFHVSVGKFKNKYSILNCTPILLGVIQRVVHQPICGILEIFKPFDSPYSLVYMYVVGWDVGDPNHRQYHDTVYYKQKYFQYHATKIYAC